MTIARTAELKWTERVRANERKSKTVTNAKNTNAVSGTLRKSHPKSKFCVRIVDDDQFVFESEKPRLTRYDNEIVILQAMLTGENQVLIEYVLKDDFEEKE